MTNRCVENQGLDVELFEAIVSDFSKVPALNTFGITFTYLGQGKAGLRMIVGQQFANFHGRAHGGIIASLLDTATGIVPFTLNCNVITLGININYIKPIQIGDEIIAHGRIIHEGRTIVLAEGEIYNQKDQLVAKSHATFYRLD